MPSLTSRRSAAGPTLPQEAVQTRALAQVGSKRVQVAAPAYRTPTIYDESSLSSLRLDSQWTHVTLRLFQAGFAIFDVSYADEAMQTARVRVFTARAA